MAIKKTSGLRKGGDGGGQGTQLNMRENGKKYFIS
jgi:hypothetical protein